MPSILGVAAQRINTATAGITGSPTAPDPNVNAGGKGSPEVPQASPAEITNLIPTEFGDLTNLFGGEAQPSQQYEPMQTALTIPGGSVRGVLGGLKPDLSRISAKPTAAVTDLETKGSEAPAQAATVIPPITTVLKNNVTKVRTFLKI